MELASPSTVGGLYPSFRHFHMHDFNLFASKFQQYFLLRKGYYSSKVEGHELNKLDFGQSMKAHYHFSF